MQEDRSHKFQRTIVEMVTEIKLPYQVIFTTSMMNPELELDDYTIGPPYTSEQRSLDLGYSSLCVTLIYQRSECSLNPHFPSIVDIQCGEKAILL